MEGFEIARVVNSIRRFFFFAWERRNLEWFPPASVAGLPLVAALRHSAASLARPVAKFGLAKQLEAGRWQVAQFSDTVLALTGSAGTGSTVPWRLI